MLAVRDLRIAPCLCNGPANLQPSDKFNRCLIGNTDCGGVECVQLRFCASPKTGTREIGLVNCVMDSQRLKLLTRRALHTERDPLGI